MARRFCVATPPACSTSSGSRATQASQEAGKWISFQKGDSLYNTIVQGVTLSSLLAELKPLPPLIESTPGTVSGQQVVGVRGGLQSAPGAGEATFWVATAAPNVPVGIDAQAKSVSTGKNDHRSGRLLQMGGDVPCGRTPAGSIALLLAGDEFEETAPGGAEIQRADVVALGRRRRPRATRSAPAITTITTIGIQTALVDPELEAVAVPPTSKGVENA